MLQISAEKTAIVTEILLYFLKFLQVNTEVNHFAISSQKYHRHISYSTVKISAVISLRITNMGENFNVDMITRN
jgi:hypothetical protein